MLFPEVVTISMAGPPGGMFLRWGGGSGGGAEGEGSGAGVVHPSMFSMDRRTKTEARWKDLRTLLLLLARVRLGSKNDSREVRCVRGEGVERLNRLSDKGGRID